jgi:hypothetical protein
VRNTFASTAMASKASFNPSSTAVTQRVVSFINGAGQRAVAVGLDRPASTVLRWLRDAHAEWLYQRAGRSRGRRSGSGTRLAPQRDSARVD